MSSENLKQDIESYNIPFCKSQSKEVKYVQSPYLPRRERKSTGDKHKFHLFDGPITPTSNLFLSPGESPEYALLNKRLKELYEKFDNEIEKPDIRGGLSKPIEVKNTMLSSLMLRRNKSEKSFRIKTILTDP